MATNPLVGQGTLNKVRGSVSFTNYPALNITASNLGTGGISFAREGDSVVMIPTNTGLVKSPQPYLQGTVTVNLLKTQNLSALFEAQLAKNAAIGNVTVTPDTSSLPDFSLTDAVIERVEPVAINTNEPSYNVVLKGTVYVNNDMWNLI